METLLDFEAPFEGLATPAPAAPARTADRTSAEILPDVPPKAARALVSYLARKGAITASGAGETYAPAAAEKIRRFADLVRGRGLSKSRAWSVLNWGEGAASPEKSPKIDPAFRTLVAEIERLRAESDAKSLESRTLLESLRTATTQIEETRRVLSDLDEERRKTRARLARIEAAARARPEGIWARLRAAWDVLIGHSAVVKALPSGEIEGYADWVKEARELDKAA